jgi:von Willebrand factor type A domain
VKLYRTIFICALAAFAHSEPALPQSGNWTFKLIVNTLDRNWQPIRDLKKGDFQIRIAGRSATVLNAEYSVAPRRILVLLDMSGSMAGREATAQWRIARAELEELLAHTPSDEPIAMLTFSDHVRDTFGFGEGRAAIANWLKALPDQTPIGKEAKRTALLDGIAEGLKMLQPYQIGDAIYAITDGDDNASTSHPATVRSDLLASHVRLFAFFFEESIPAQLRKNDEFFDMIGASGGVAFGPVGRRLRLPGVPSWQVDYADEESNQKLIRLSVQAINALVPGFWEISIAAPKSTKKLARVSLHLIDGQGHPIRDDIQAVYPKETVPPPE